MNEAYLDMIARMDILQLFAEVMEHPEYLTDRYYKVFGDAFRRRYAELAG